MTLDHLGDVRNSTLLYQLTKHLVTTKFRDPCDEPKLYLFGQLKKIAKQWVDSCLKCKGNTYPALLMYRELADMACQRITTGITAAYQGDRPIHVLLDPYNPTGSTAHVRLSTSTKLRWETRADRCHINWAILHSDWEAEFCRVVESHPRVRRYVKNYGLGFEVPYRYGSNVRRYQPDFVVVLDDGHGEEDLLNLVTEIKGYRLEDAKEKKSTMENYWVPGVNELGRYGRWAFVEFTDLWGIQDGFAKTVEEAFGAMIDSLVSVRK